MALFFTLIIFFCENKLFQRGWEVFVFLCGNSRGVGGAGAVISSLQIWKIQGGGGGGVLSEIPSTLGYGYFLESHVVLFK